MKSSSERIGTVAQMLEHAVQLHRSGDRSSAQKIYRKILKTDPGHSDALNFLALAMHQAGNLDEAIRLMRQALASNPDNPAAIRNLGNLMVESERFDEAVTLYTKALTFEPNDASIHANLCVAYRQLGEHDRAIQSGLMATRLSPDQLVTWYSLGNAWRAKHKFTQAINAYRKALSINSKFTPAHDNLCRCTLALESTSLLGRCSFRKTRKAYEDWLRQDPDNAVAAFMLQAIKGEVVDRAPDSVIKGLFDGTAGTFEAHLSRLEYRVPELFEKLLAVELGEPKEQLAVLDAGCGTGLCAPFLRPYAQCLVGVDLSAGMLEKARQRGSYDDLQESELTKYFQSCSEVYDLVILADTLCYFGGLENVLRGIMKVMCPGGLLGFTVEKAVSQKTNIGFRLHPQGRYSHAQSYVESTLKQAGFHSIKFRNEVLRMELREPVVGFLVTARC